MFQWLRRKREERETAVRLYAEVVKLARAPELYRTFAVPDTLDGRFDSLVLHSQLVFRRLGRLGPGGQRLSQKLFDVMFLEMDETLRELGVGDLSVGKKVRQMAEAFYGRAKAYDGALKADAGQEALEVSLVRNLYGGAGPEPALVARLAAYVRSLDQAIGGLSLETLQAAHLPPATYADEDAA